MGSLGDMVEVKAYGKTFLAAFALATVFIGDPILQTVCKMGTLVISSGTAFSAEPRAPVITREQIEADWLRQDELRNAPPAVTGKKVTPEQDALGAFDGIINGEWGFHTENENNPWWQIDLGEPTSIGRIVLYNRCKLAERNSRIIVLLCDDGKSFKQAYQHDGTTFYGFTDKKPLTIKLNDAKARYVRLQLPSKSYFHLDEVQIYSPDSNRNIATGKTATQSSVSQWSVAHTIVTAPTPYPTAKIVRRGLLLLQVLYRSTP